MFPDIRFLTNNNPVSLSGFEFMDYQKPDFYNALVEFFNNNLEKENDIWELPGDRITSSGIYEVIMEHTGMNVELIPPSIEVPNATVEAGFFNPGNVMNIKGIEDWLGASESEVGKAFRSLQKKVLKGWVDTSTGKVGGDYSDIPIKLWLNKYVSDFIKVKFIQKNRVTMAEALASIILHECGHIFTGFLHIHKAVIDPLMTFHAIKLIKEGKLYGKQRVTIVKDTFSILGCNETIKDNDLDKFEPEELIVLFNKGITNRDMRRTLSIGVNDRSSEVYADMYAIRFGVPKTMVIALSSFPTYAGLFYSAIGVMGVAVMGAIVGHIPAMVLYGVLSLFFFLVDIQFNHLPGNMYDSPYRRVKNILIDHIVRINNDKSLDSRTKSIMIKDAKEMDKLVENNKTILEGTAIQRFVGWVFSGTDFKAQDFEHYTDELIGHTLSIYTNEF